MPCLGFLSPLIASTEMNILAMSGARMVQDNMTEFVRERESAPGLSVETVAIDAFPNSYRQLVAICLRLTIRQFLIKNSHKPKARINVAQPSLEQADKIRAVKTIDVELLAESPCNLLNLCEPAVHFFRHGHVS
jgi:hypothetical protein